MKYTQKVVRTLHRNNICSIFCCTVVLVFLSWLPVGCSKKEDEDPIKIAHVLLVYLAVDNDLSGESYSKLEAFAEDGSLRRIPVYWFIRMQEEPHPV